MPTLSVYYDPHHDRQGDKDYIQRLQPNWVRIHQVTAKAIADVHRLAPNAKIMLRRWEIDDHNGDRKQEAYSNPRGAALRHLELWDEVLRDLEAELRRNGWAYNKANWYIGLLNEPDPAHLVRIVEYTEEAMRLATLRGQRLGVLVPSVGNFGKPGEGNSWDLCKPLEKAINDGGHILVVHEYWQKEGAAGVWIDHEGKERSDAGNLAWRHRHIPMNVPILIGEAGANGYIFGRTSQRDDCGWADSRMELSAEAFAGQVRDYIAGCDTRVQGVCLYMTDYHDDQWRTFDTAPAHEQLLAIKDTAPSNTVHLPIVNNGAVSHEDLFERSMTFLRKWEGGFQNNPEDHGNWTGGRKGVGELKGTKFGISAASYPDLDIVNLTQEQADAIYRRDYWQRSGADKLQWPACLLIFDTAVLHGVGTALNWQKEVGTDAFVLAAKRLRRYTQLDNWSVFGAGWTNRVAALLEEIGRNI